MVRERQRCEGAGRQGLLAAALLFAGLVTGSPGAAAALRPDASIRGATTVAAARGTKAAGACTDVTGLVVVGATETLPCVTVERGGTLELYNPNGCGGLPAITLTLSTGGTIEPGGAVGMYSSNSCDEGGSSGIIISSGTLVNHGSLVASWLGPGPDTPAGGQRSITGNVTNYGTVAVDDTLYLVGPATFDNEGTFDIEATGSDACQAWAQVQSKGVTFDNAVGASIVSAGRTGCAGRTTGLLTLGPGNKFIEAGRVVSGTPVAKTGTVVQLDGDTLDYTGPKAGAIGVQGAITLKGDMAKNQTLELDGASGFCQEPPAVVTVSGPFTNAGTITWNCNVGDISLSVPSGTFTNSGTLTGPATLSGNIDNTGSLSVGANQVMTYLRGKFTNAGSFTVAQMGTFAVTASAGAIFTNAAAGEVTNAGSVSMGGGNTFVEAGAINGIAPVLVGDELRYTGTGRSSITVQGTTTLAGDIAKGQTLSLYAASGFCQNPSAAVTAAAGFTNNGTITAICGGGPATLTVKSGTLVNGGLILGSPGSMTIDAHVDNAGSLESEGPAGLTISSLANYSATSHTLRGGTYIAAGTNGITVNGMDVHTLDATVVLDGAQLGNGTSSALANLASNDGNLTAVGASPSTSGGFTNNGDLTVGPNADLVVNGAFKEAAGATFTWDVLSSSSSSGYGQLTVRGPASLAGTMSITKSTGYKVAAGDSAPVIACSQRTGHFKAVRGTSAGGGLHFTLSYSSTGVVVKVGR